MKKIAFVLLLTGLFQSAINAQSLPLKKVQYDFLVWYFHYKHLAPLSDTTIRVLENFGTIKDMDKILRTSSLFTKREIIFFNKQLRFTNKNTVLDTLAIHGIVWQNNFSAYTPSLHISLPVFSADKNMALINYEYFCGQTCGKQSIEVYVKNKAGKWKFSDRFKFPVVVF